MMIENTLNVDDEHSNAQGEEHKPVQGDAAGHDDAGHAVSAENWTIQDSMDHYLSPGHLISHVQDSYHFETLLLDEEGNKNKIDIPWISPWTEEKPLIGENGLIEVSADNQFIGPVTFQPSKFVILELLGALIVCAVFIPYARRVRDGSRPRGRFSNMLDAAVCYIRDEVAVPGIGSQDAKRFLPFIWTIFFFVLVLNLIGMVPGFGAATSSISVTAALALSVFVVVIGTGMRRMGVVGFIKAQAPHLDINPVLKFFLVPMIWAIEMFGLLIKHAVLAVRLFANMFAGHLVVGVFVAFIGVTWGSWMVYGAAPVVILATIAVNLLELLVAFIQAYVFAFLTSLFIGAAIHPH
ncbi:MAG: F-type H+-transporting ATPase subunit a [Mariniblastus sp.]|jgi:F-type H+-transporting ATPase subunit a